MSADRELLELAAKSAGFSEIDFLAQDHWANVYDAQGRQSAWNPLADDGDALRLVVKLSLTVKVMDDHVRVGWSGCIQWIGETCLPFDRAAMSYATRRAIVRAAAEIGRSMP